ncbi:hypothetical protein [Aureliella helgolandensis]|uniref:Uncharacterized protein n=1 Tax=Aureliella helgolandensis TaxID=2527968 RepID=A0A518GC23_9BACT|nr:hypothetical protein [Aureliella helgolandensis]QDV26080.1 hypothetical protein Q31a_44510 [Aureliella helgolandensis]
MKRKKRYVPLKQGVAISPLARLLRRKAGLETVCQRCSGLFLEEPAPVSGNQIPYGSAVVSIFVDERFGRQHYYLKLGRYRAAGAQIRTSEYLNASDIDDAIEALWMSKACLTEPYEKVRAKR